MFINHLSQASVYLQDRNHALALIHLRCALPYAQRGRQWAMTMHAIRSTLKALNHA